MFSQNHFLLFLGSFFRMFWILVCATFMLSIFLVLTIAYLFVYLGYYTEITVQTLQEPMYSNALIAYKGTEYSQFAYSRVWPNAKILAKKKTKKTCLLQNGAFIKFQKQNVAQYSFENNEYCTTSCFSNLKNAPFCKRQFSNFKKLHIFFCKYVFFAKKNK